MHRRSSRVFFLAALLSASLLPLRAQVVGGTISGVVEDSTGAAIPGATVTVRNTETGATRALVTGADGRFSAPSVPVGSYSIVAAHSGFKSEQRDGLTLVIGQSLDLTFQLGVGAVTQQVIVGGQTFTINTTTEQTSGLIDERQVKELPLNGRSYDQLLTLNPAAVNYTDAALRQHRHFELLGRQHVRRQRPPPAGQSLPAERHRVHRRVAHQRHPRRHQRPAARRRRHPRVQRGHRHLRRQLRQARRRADLHRHRSPAPTAFHGSRLRIPPQQLLRRAQLLRPGADPRVPAQQLRRSPSAARSRRTSSSSSATTRATARTSASATSPWSPTTPHAPPPYLPSSR